jgi:hypothetical protein
MRDASEQNLRQAHAVYEQILDFMTKAMDTWMGAMPASPMTAGFQDVQGQIMELVKENAEAAFTLAGKISNAPSLQDVLTLQTQFAQDRMQTFVTQTQPLRGRLAVKKISFPPRVRLSKMVVRKPLRRFHPLHRSRNSKSNTSISDGNRRRRPSDPKRYSTLRPHGQRTTITSWAAKSPRRNHRSSFFCASIRTKYPERMPLLRAQ